jgi:hypothetical protein
MGRAKIERLLNVFEFFFYVFDFSFKFNKTAALRGNRQKMSEICGDLQGDRPRGLLASYWLKLGGK